MERKLHFLNNGHTTGSLPREVFFVIHRFFVSSLLLVPFVFLQCSYPSWKYDAGTPQDRMDLTPAIHHVKGGVYVVRDYNYWQTNSVFYISDQGVIFIDALYTHKSARLIHWKAMTLTQAPFVGLILTSHTLHHSGGGAFFHAENIPVVIQEKGYFEIKSQWKNMNDQMEREFPSFFTQRFFVPDGVIRDKADFLNGKVKVYYPGPAHSIDNLVVYFPEENIVYAGSILADPLMFSDEMNQSNYLKALDFIDSLHPDTVISGHGDPVRSAEFVKAVRRNVKEKILNTVNLSNTLP